MSRAILLNLPNVVLLFLLCTSLPSKAIQNEINCLESVRPSLEDPLGKLNSWIMKNDINSICDFAGVHCHSYDNKYDFRLSNMGLKGQFPRGIENCTSLTSLDLSNNQLEGPIPFDIGKLIPFVTTLDLSYNNFSGEIPPSIESCRYLNVPKLNSNRFIGIIPKNIGLMSEIFYFNVANNSLTGPVPTFIHTTVSKECFANNSGLCGPPLKPCKEELFKFEIFKKAFSIGYVVFFVFVVVALAPYDINIPSCIKFQMPKITRNNKVRETYPVTDLATIDKLQGCGKEILRLEKMVPRLPYANLSNATNNFSERNIIGLGKMGIMFKATLSTGHFLAVKKLNYSQLLDEPFIIEIKILGVLRHINLLPLVGFCIKSKERFLVYKYMPNGRLYDWLHSMWKDQAKIVMEWPLRVKIAIGLARGLAWLHQGCNIRVFHLNINSKCILLDQNFEPKLKDFGEAIFIIPTNNTEFWEMAFVKEDVYSFGIVLLELITREDSSRYGSSNEWVSDLLNSNSSTFHDLIDKSLIGQGFDDEIYQFLQIAFNCVQSIPEQRSTMLQVYEQIKAIRERGRLADDDSKLLTKPETSTAGNKGKSLDEIEIVENY